MVSDLVCNVPCVYNVFASTNIYNEVQFVKIEFKKSSINVQMCFCSKLCPDISEVKTEISTKQVLNISS